MKLKNKKQTQFKKLYNKFTKNFLFLTTIFMMSSIYYTFISWNVIPLLYSSDIFKNKIIKFNNFNDKNYSLGIIYLILFHYLLFWLIISLINLSIKDCGELSTDYKNEYSLTNKNIENNTHTNICELKSNKLNKSLSIEDINDFKSSLYSRKYSSDSSNQKNFRTCRFCLIVKPERTHHCRKCRKCVRKLDHHCMFLNVCVGIGNQKYFILFLLYSTLLLLFVSISMISSLKTVYLDYGLDSIEFIFLSGFILCCSVIGISILFLLCFHISLIANNLTTLEYNEKFKKNREKIKNNSYNISLIYNIKSVLGNNILLWLFPIDIDRSNLGYNFIKK